MIVLGEDPGLAITGFARLDTVTGSRSTHTYRTAPGDWLESRITDITFHAQEVIAREQPDLVAIEGYGYQGQTRTQNRNAVIIPRIVGALEGVARALGTPVIVIPRGDILAALCGSRKAPKEAVKAALKARGYEARNEHERDAIAAALVGAQRVRLERGRRA